MPDKTSEPKTEAGTNPENDLELDTNSKPGVVSDVQESRDKETLDKAEALLKTAKTAEDYQQLAKLYAEVEKAYADPEKQGEHLKGRDPEKFLKEVFDWKEKNSGLGADFKERWVWKYFEKTGLIRTGLLANIPPEFIDETKEINQDFSDDASGDAGIGTLLEKLKGRRVIPIAGTSSENPVFPDLFLQVVEGEDDAKAETKKQAVEWQKFYEEMYGYRLDLSEVEIPERREGFDHLVIVDSDAVEDIAGIWAKCQSWFPCELAVHIDLDDLSAVASERDESDAPYAIWVKSTAENDKWDARHFNDNNMHTMTLQERLLLELKIFSETGKHFDKLGEGTLCSGSSFTSSGILARDQVPVVKFTKYHGEDTLIINSTNQTLAERNVGARAVITH